MDKLSNVVIKPMEKSKYLKPYILHFEQNGRKRAWELLTVHESVTITLYNISRNVLVLVKQFRPAVYFGSISKEDRKIGTKIDVEKYPATLGITIELCAGTMNKKLSEAEIAKEKIFKECGYAVQLTSLTKVGSYYSRVGISAALENAFYCEVTDDMKVARCSGGVDQITEIVEMTVDEVKEYITQSVVNSSPSFLFGIYWFLLNKGKRS